MLFSAFEYTVLEVHPMGVLLEAKKKLSGSWRAIDERRL